MSSSVDDIYDRIQRSQEEQNQRQRLEIANQVAPDYDRAARIFAVEANTKLPYEVVDADLDNLEKKLKASQFNYDDYTDRINGAPAFNKFVAENPYHLSVLERDHKELSRLERAYRQTSLSWQSGWAMTEVAEIRTRQIANFENPDNEKDKARLDRLHDLLEGGNFGADSVFAKVMTGTAQQLPIMAWLTGEALDEIAIGAAVGAARGAVIGSGAGGVGALPGALSGLVVGAGFGARGGFAEAAYRLERGLAYDEYVGMGLDEEQARWASAAVGGANAALEMIGLGALTKRIPGVNRILNDRVGGVINSVLNQKTMKQAVARATLMYGEGVATELLTEAAQEATLIVGREYLKRWAREAGDIRPETEAIAGEGGVVDIFTSRDFWSEIGAIAAHTLYATVLIGGVGPGANLIRDSRRVRTAEQRLAAFDAMGDAAEKSETRKNVPTKYEEFVNKLVGPDGKILIEARRFIDYFQEQGMDADEVAASLGVKNLADAEANGLDIELPAGQYISKIAGTEHHKGLQRDLKRKPDEMSANEAQIVKESMVKQINEMQDLAAKENPEQAREDAEIQNKLKERLIEGGTSPEAAEYQAMIMVGIPNLARRAGKTDLEKFQQERFGGIVFTTNAQMRANKENFDPYVDPYLDRIRAGDFPSQKSIFGPNMVERIRASGGLAPDSELDARDIKLQFSGLIREGGDTLDGIAEILHDEGFIAERDPNMVLDALDRMANGEDVFGNQFTVDEQQRELLTALEQLASTLDQHGIDITDMTNADVRKALSEIDTFYQDDTTIETDVMNDLADLVFTAAEHDPQMLARAAASMPNLAPIQEFGDVKFVDDVTVDGKPGTRTRAANKEFEMANERKDSLKKLRDCLGG